jgi:hypothetical protein
VKIVGNVSGVYKKVSLILLLAFYKVFFLFDLIFKKAIAVLGVYNLVDLLFIMFFIVTAIVHNINIRWAPGHIGIEGNELADKLADAGALQSQNDIGLAAKPTASGIRSIARKLREGARQGWWEACYTKLSLCYRR